MVDRKTLGQVFGVEAMAAGGREGAKLALSTWQELRTYGVAKATEIECNRNGLHPSQEELASEIADCLAGGKHLPNVGDVTVARYL